jgi:cell division protein FtsI (penicillin-binding protein 3)
VREILEQSSDVGTIKIALRLGESRFYDTIRDFGIGQLTGIELPGENRGLLRPVENWSANSIGSIAIGQEVSVTPVQIISAASAIANGGTLYRPRIVREIQPDASSPARAQSASQQATDAKSAATVREMMEGVVLEGTGKPAKLDGYTAAGKSGTAQEIDAATGRYSPNQYVASFVGFAPVNEPVVTILVVFDSPVGQHFGGDVGGPVFKRVAEQVLAYMDAPHDVPMPSNLQTAKNLSRTPEQDSSNDINEARYQAAVAQKAPPETPAATVAFSEEDAVLVPDLAGRTVRGVTEECSRLGLVPSLIGSGVALEQSPEAGARVERGSSVTVRFGRAVAALTPASVQRNAN